jgi:hypothetical protein
VIQTIVTQVKAVHVASYIISAISNKLLIEMLLLLTLPFTAAT